MGFISMEDSVYINTKLVRFSKAENASLGIDPEVYTDRKWGL